MGLRRIKLTVAYDGTDYHGWQYQPNVPTIEGVLNSTLSEFLGEDIKVIGASRTDAGVHAYGNIAVFDTASSIPGDKFTYAVNRFLPDDIKIQQSEEVALDFHPRHQDVKKTYEYRILYSKCPIPTKRRYNYWVYNEPDIIKMKAACKYLEGTHDFMSFCSTATDVLTTVRTVYSLDVNIENGNEYVVRITGSGFLYNMVRIIVGTLLEVGYGRIRPEAVAEILDRTDRTCAGPTAPAHGLCLVGYEFLSATDVV